MVGGAVGAHQARAVEGEGDRELLERDVVDDLVEAALQERGVDRAHGSHALGGEPRCEGHAVLLGDPHVVHPVGVSHGELVESGAVRHRRRQRDHARVAIGEPRECLREHARPTRRARRSGLAFSRLGVERRRGVPLERVGLGRRVALALARLHVKQGGAGGVAQPGDGLQQGIEVVAVDGAAVVQVERTRVARDVAGPVQTAHVGGDRHPVVVEHDAQIGAQVPRVIERLVRHARRCGTVADHRDRPPARARARRTLGDAERGTDRSPRVTRAEDVVRALHAAQEPRRAVRLLDARERVPAPGQHLVAVGLVPDVPTDAVVGRVEGRVQCDGQLDRAETAREVPARGGADFDQVGPQFLGDLMQAVPIQGAQRLRVIDRRQEFQRLPPLGAFPRRTKAQARARSLPGGRTRKGFR